MALSTRKYGLIALELLGLIWGTLLVCNPAVVNGFSIWGWLISLVSTFALLLTCSEGVSSTVGRIQQLLLALTVVFVTVFLTCIATALAGV